MFVVFCVNAQLVLSAGLAVVVVVVVVAVVVVVVGGGGVNARVHSLASRLLQQRPFPHGPCRALGADRSQQGVNHRSHRQHIVNVVAITTPVQLHVQ